jgi:chitinase
VVDLGRRSIAIVLSPNESLVCTFTSTNTRDAASVVIRDFLTARNAKLLADQPNIQRRLDRLTGAAPRSGMASAFGLALPGSANLPVNVSFAPGQMTASTSFGMAQATSLGDKAEAKPFDIWAEANISSLDYGDKKGRFSLLYLGSDYRISDTVLVGGLVQFDRYKRRGASGEGALEGDGWMAGPYLMAKISPDLFFDVRAAWGKSNNTISPLGTFTDGFDTGRVLYSGSLIGQFSFGENTRVYPEVSIRYLSEKQKAYLDKLGVSIPGRTVDQGDFSFRPRIDHDVPISDQWKMRLFGTVEGIYTFGLDPDSVLENNFRMRVEGGTDFISQSSVRLSFSGYFDGLGSGGYKSGGGRFEISFGF